MATWKEYHDWNRQEDYTEHGGGAIKSKHTLLISDACFGGIIFKTRAVGSIITRFHKTYDNSSRKALASGNLTEVPDNSIFMKNLEENTDAFLPSTTLYKGYTNQF